MKEETTPGEQSEIREAYDQMDGPEISSTELMEGIGAGMQRRQRRRQAALRISMVGIVVVIVGVVAVQVVRAMLPDVPVTTSPGKTGAVTSGQRLSCVSAYDSEELVRRDWAADATVKDIKISGPDAEVILRVNHWYRGGETDEVNVSMSSPWVDEDSPPAYGIGTRLLVSGSKTVAITEHGRAGFLDTTARRLQRRGTKRSVEVVYRVASIDFLMFVIFVLPSTLGSDVKSV